MEKTSNSWVIFLDFLFVPCQHRTSCLRPLPVHHAPKMLRPLFLLSLVGALALPPPVAFWRFQESAAPYLSTGSAGPYALLQGNASQPINTVPAPSAPFGARAAYFGPRAGFNNSARLYAPRDAVPAITEGISGPQATVTLVAWVSVPHQFQPEGMVAGVWDEYGVEGGSTGARAYALFLNLGTCAPSGGSAYNHGLAAHISPVGGPTPGNRYCTTAACDSRALLPSPAWHCLAGTYDGSAIRAYVNGTLVSNAWRNPYNLTGGIFSPDGLPGRVGAEFGVGANRINATVGAPPQWSNTFAGLLGGLAVWGSALGDEEVAQACALARGF
jgi:hypothetical protein